VLASLALPGSATTRPGSALVAFSGKGDRTLPPFRVSVPSTLSWHNSGKLFSISPQASKTFDGAVASGAHAGTTYLPPGRYSLRVLARGTWRLEVRPGAEPVRRVGGAIVFSGNGRKALPPFRVAKDSYMHWASAPGLFQLRNTTSSAGAISASDRRGIVYLPPGQYALQVLSALGRWSLRITGI
jgi:hypothetical protein